MPRSSAKVFKKRKGVYYPKKSGESTGIDTTSDTNKNECASEKKMPDLNESYSKCSSTDEVSIIIDLKILAGIFQDHVRCKVCESGLDLSFGNNFGLALDLYLKCKSCEYSCEFNTSQRHADSKMHVINTKFVYAMRSIGKGAEGGRVFCGLMNLPNPPTRFAGFTAKLLHSVKEVCKDSMQEAVFEAVQENNNSPNLAVGVDGSWQKRGYTSLNGIVSVTSIDTGKVLDIEVLSKYCSCVNKMSHSTNCKKNFDGVSGKMEVDGAVAIFERSVEQYGVRYTKYLGDGDSKAYHTVNERNIYGEDYPLEKLECIGHIQKRMGTRLRKLKETMKGKVLSDGKRLGGKNRLTDAQIDLIQNYYGLAIRRNLSSLTDMKQAVWAIFLHKVSTDENPQHGFCPQGEDTWCKFHKAAAKNESYHHANSLPVAVVETMRPIFRDLAHPDLLKKCLHGNTQNPNESLNNLIWSRAPKTTFVQLETLSLAVYDAVICFNQGNIARMNVLKKMGIEPGYYTSLAMKRLDEERLLRARYAHSQQTKNKRKERRLKRKRESENLKKKPQKAMYGAGVF